MEVIIGEYVYMTKIHLIAFKSKLKDNYEYFRDNFDYIIIKKGDATIKIAQDGLIYIKKNIKNLSEINHLQTWLNDHIISRIPILDKEDPFYTNILQANKDKRTVIIVKPTLDVQHIYKTINRNHDYKFKTKNITKNSGDSLILFSNIKLDEKELENLLEQQIIFSSYQNLVKSFINYNKNVWIEVTKLRKQEKMNFKELNNIIYHLIDKKRKIDVILKKLNRLEDSFILRKNKCEIIDILESLKLNDFDEMVVLNKNIRSQFEMTRHYISSTIELITFIYRENEQKELNILQVIFAIGAIGTIVSLGAMPGAKLFLSMTDNQIVGELISFDTQTLIIWTLISVGIAIFLFLVLNYVFMSAKKLKIINWVKKIEPK